MDPLPASAGSRGELGRLLQAVLTSRGQANAVFDILAVLQVSRAGGGGGKWESHLGPASPCLASPLSPRTLRISRKECARAADSSVPCWSGKSCSWDRCRGRTRSWQVSDLEALGCSAPGRPSGTPYHINTTRRNMPKPGPCHRLCAVEALSQSTLAQEVRSVDRPGLHELVYLAVLVFLSRFNCATCKVWCYHCPGVWEI